MPRICKLAFLLSAWILLPPNGYADSIDERLTKIFYDVRVAKAQGYFGAGYNDDLQRLIDLGPAAVPELIGVVRTAPMRSTRMSLAIDALGHHRDPRALPCLIEAVSYRQFRGGKALSSAIAQFGEDAIDLLAPLAKSGASSCRYVAMSALKKIGGPRTASVCLEVIRQADDEQSMMIAIGMIADFADPKFELMLLELLSNELNKQRIYGICGAVIDALGTTGTSRKGNAALIQILKTEESGYRKLAASALGNRKAIEAIPLLIQLLGRKRQAINERPEPASNVGAMRPVASLGDVVIDALAAFAPTVTGPELIEATSDLHSELGSGALSVLSKVTYPPAKEIFVDALLSKHLPRVTRLNALRGLTKLADPSTIKVLLSVSEDIELRAGDDLVDALVAMGPAARTSLLDLLDNGSAAKRMLGLQALCRIGEKSDFQVLATEIVKPEYKNSNAASDFFELADSRADPLLDKALWRLARSNSLEAINILSQRPNADANRIQGLVRAYLPIAPNWVGKLQVLPVLERIGSSDCVREVSELLNHERDDVRHQAAKVLAKHDQAALLAHLARFPNQPDKVFEVLLPLYGLPAVQRLIVKLLDTPEPNLPLLRVLGKNASFDPDSNMWPGANDVLLSKIGKGTWSYCPELIASAMAVMGDDRAINAIIDAHPERFVWALQVYGHRALTDRIVKLLPRYPNVARLLGVIGDQSTVEPLIRSTQNRREYHGVISALGEIGGPKAADFLLKEFSKNQPSVATHDAIMKLDRDLIVPRLTKLLKDPACELHVAIALGLIGTPETDLTLKTHIATTKSTKTREFIKKNLPGVFAR